VGLLVWRIAYIVMIIFFPEALAGRWVAPDDVLDRAQHLSFGEVVQLLSTLASAFFVLRGVVVLRRSRLAAYAMFKTSVLITLLVTQVFVFFEREFEALVGFFFYLLLLIALDYMITREQALEEKA
jgi:hypothetical protein